VTVACLSSVACRWHLQNGKGESGVGQGSEALSAQTRRKLSLIIERLARPFYRRQSGVLCYASLYPI
jgi:hypothetical protein